jgi:MFS family permease
MKPLQLGILCLAVVLPLSVWFAGTAAAPALLAAGRISSAEAGWLAASVQLGFVAGTLVSAVLGLADRWPERRFFAGSAALAGCCALLQSLLAPAGWESFVLRALAGACMAGVYPVGMKLAAGWAGPRDAGIVVGLLVGGLTLGSASPHLVNALGGMGWRGVVAAASVAALLGAGLILCARLGPGHRPAPPFRPGLALRLFQNRGTRLATLGYLGHMWELYAMWAWVGAYLAASFAAAGSAANAAAATFAVMAAGTLGCIGGGLLADRIGKARLTIWAMAISGTCCLLAGPLFSAAPGVVMLLCLVWGAAAVADSAQFSASVAEAADPGLAGTMLTVQTSLGFALTLPAIHLMPWLAGQFGWGGAFAALAIGPALGCLAMARLLPARG